MGKENDVVVEKCTALWKQIETEEREKAGFQDKAKACQKRIDQKLGEIKRITLTAGQGELELVPPAKEEEPTKGKGKKKADPKAVETFGQFSRRKKKGDGDGKLPARAVPHVESGSSGTTNR